METDSLGGVNLGGRHPLRLNVGYMLHESIGFSRDFDYDEAILKIDDDLQVNQLRGSVRLTRTTQGIYVQGKLRTVTPQTCVRCLSDFDQSLTIELGDLFVYPPNRATEPLLVIPETGTLDLTPLVREYLLLEVPLQPMCQADCQGLCPVCGNDRNKTECQHGEPEIDPRLAVLKSLLDKS